MLERAHIMQVPIHIKSADDVMEEAVNLLKHTKAGKQCKAKALRLLLTVMDSNDVKSDKTSSTDLEEEQVHIMAQTLTLMRKILTTCSKNKTIQQPEADHHREDCNHGIVVNQSLKERAHLLVQKDRVGPLLQSP